MVTAHEFANDRRDDIVPLHVLDISIPGLVDGGVRNGRRTNDPEDVSVVCGNPIRPGGHGGAMIF